MKRAVATGTKGATLVILAGGRSSRMGRPKAGLPVEGQTLLEWMVRGLAPAFAETLVCGARAPPGARSVADRHPAAGHWPASNPDSRRRAPAMPSSLPVTSRARRHDSLRCCSTASLVATPPCPRRSTGSARSAATAKRGPAIAHIDAGGRRLFGLIEQLKTAYVDKDELTSAGIAGQELADLDVPGDYDAFIRWRRPPA